MKETVLSNLNKNSAQFLIKIILKTNVTIRIPTEISFTRSVKITRSNRGKMLTHRMTHPRPRQPLPTNQNELQLYPLKFLLFLRYFKRIYNNSEQFIFKLCISTILMGSISEKGKDGL